MTVRLVAEGEAWSRLWVTRETVAEVVAKMSGSGGADAAPMPGERMAPAALADVLMVGGVMVPHWREGRWVDALLDVYRDIVGAP